MFVMNALLIYAEQRRQERSQTLCKKRLQTTIISAEMVID